MSAILALDLGTQMGWAMIGDDDQVDNGIDFSDMAEPNDPPAEVAL